MELWDYEFSFGAGKRALLRRCEADVRTFAAYGHGPLWERCGGVAMRGATWEGRVEGIHSALLCNWCTVRYLGPMIPEGK